MSNSANVLKEIVRILGEHDGNPMSSAPSRAAEIARKELKRLGVHEQEMHTRRPTVIGRG